MVRMGRIWNFIWIEYPRNFEYEIEYKYSVGSNSLKILNGVKMSYCDVASFLCWRHWHHGHMHRSYCLLSDLTMKTTFYRRQTYPHISYVHTHIRLQNKIIYIPLENKIKNKLAQDLRWLHGAQCLL